jgi:AcrR family transcriptional regulator
VVRGAGFLDATFRQIAAAAEVDPALVHHFFGVKDQLFITLLGSALNGRRLSVCK